jgi:hypothetical protein
MPKLPVTPKNTGNPKLTPMQKMIMKEFGVSASAAAKAASRFAKLENKTQKTGPNSIYSFDQKGLNYGKATKKLK